MTFPCSNGFSDDSADVIGYLHRSLVDNYEWHEDYAPKARFGLFHIDRSTTELNRLQTNGAQANFIRKR
jgi:beta-glucosidase/6-phospho-beta-glucosidase/beta-galactosidase